MAKLSKEELLGKIKTVFGDELSDAHIEVIEDISDTLDESSSDAETEDWKAKFEENDKMWRTKYTERFFAPTKEEKKEEKKEDKKDEESEDIDFDDILKEV